MSAGSPASVTAAVRQRPGIESSSARAYRGGWVQPKPHVEGGAMLGGVEGHRPAVALHDDPAGGVEPKAGAAADLLGREERLEHVRANLERDAGSAVCDIHQDALPV